MTNPEGDPRIADLERAVDRTRRSLTRRLRARALAEGWAVGAIGFAATAAWRAVVDPAFPWVIGGLTVAGAALLVSITVAARHRVGADAAARVLDRAAHADDRIVTARASARTALSPVVTEEARALIDPPPALPHRRIGRPVAWAAGGAIAAGVLAAVAPPPPEATRGRSEIRATDALRELVSGRAGRPDPALAAALATVAAAPDRERTSPDGAARLAAAIEAAERRARTREALEAALGEDEIGRGARTALDPEVAAPSGDGAAAATADRLTRAAAAVEAGGDARVAALLREIASALRARRLADRALAARRLDRSAGGGEVSSTALADARRALKSAALSAKGSTSSGPRPGRAPAEGAPVVGSLRDPTLSAVIDRYFRQVDSR